MEWLTVKEAAEKLRRTEDACRKLCCAGELPAVKVGKKWLVNAEALEKMLALEDRWLDTKKAHA